MYYVHPSDPQMTVSGYKDKESATDHARGLCLRDGSASVRSTITGMTLRLVLVGETVKYRVEL